MTKFIIASRRSPLALWQAEHVKSTLQHHHPKLRIEIKTFVTKGDKHLDSTLAKVGGKGLFLKELQKAMLDGEADMAVHSLKDIPAGNPEPGLSLACITKRADMRDAFISERYTSLESLPEGATVGTSSFRRQAQLLSLFPHITIKPCRGNVNTRLEKLHLKEYDAILLAACGLDRLGLKDSITLRLPTHEFIPAVGQGALGIECRENDNTIKTLLAPLNHNETEHCITAERALSHALNGSCHTPLGAFAHYKDNKLSLSGFVGMPDGSKIIRAEISDNTLTPTALGLSLANNLLEKGADTILKEVLS